MLELVGFGYMPEESGLGDVTPKIMEPFGFCLVYNINVFTRAIDYYGGKRLSSNIHLKIELKIHQFGIYF